MNAWTRARQQRWSIAFLLLSLGWLANHPAPAADSAESLRGRIGFYQWRGPAEIGLQPNAGEGQDLLTLARQRTVEAGGRVFRFYLGGRFDYAHPVLSPRRFADDGVEGPLTLERIISLPRYKAALADPNIATIVLTAYPVHDYGGGPDDLNLLRPWGPELERLEREQTTALGEWLFREFGDTDKTVILANHEADEKIMDIANYTGSPEVAIDTFRNWTRTRFEAVDAVRQAHPKARLRLLHAFEIALVNLRIVLHRGGFRKAAPQTPQQGWSALHDVAPHVPFDLISYSSYESTNSPYETQNPDQPPAETGVRLKRDLDRIRSVARPSLSPAGRKYFGDNFIMLGELGYARDRFEHLPSGPILPRLYAALRAAVEAGCPYVVLWQVFDHPLDGGEAWGFGMYDRAEDAPKLRAPDGGCDSIRACLELLFANGFDGWAKANQY
jgi:hypothetical protein